MSHLIKNGLSLLRIGNTIFGIRDTVTYQSSNKSGFTTPTAIALDVVNDRYYVYQNNGTVRIMQRSTDLQIALIPGFASGPKGGIALDTPNDRYYVVAWGKLQCMRKSTDVQIAVNTTTVPASYMNIALDIPNNQVYITCYDFPGGIYIFDATTLVLKTFISATTPWGIAVDSVTNLFYVVRFNANIISIYNRNNNTFIKTIPGGFQSLTFDDLSNRYYGAGSGDCAIFQKGTDALISNFPIPVSGYQDIAVDMANNVIYTTSQNIGAITKTVFQLT